MKNIIKCLFLGYKKLSKLVSLILFVGQFFFFHLRSNNARKHGPKEIHTFNFIHTDDKHRKFEMSTYQLIQTFS